MKEEKRRKQTWAEGLRRPRTSALAAGSWQTLAVLGQNWVQIPARSLPLFSCRCVSDRTGLKASAFYGCCREEMERCTHRQRHTEGTHEMLLPFPLHFGAGLAWRLRAHQRSIVAELRKKAVYPAPSTLNGMEVISK